ncbi:MAG: FMN-binding protein [Spirochaetales bacterium]|nr:FMN-binding protein [Spirochaetales bacterium]
MKEVMNIGGRLALICAVAAIILGIVNSVTSPKIEQLKIEALNEALSAVVPQGEIGDNIPVSEEGVIRSYHQVTDSSGEITGYVVSMIGAGYAGDLKMIAGYTLDGALNASVLMEDQETPGLGKEAEKPSYMAMFQGKGGDEPMPVRKSQLPQDRADSISGATITFIGVAKALESGSEYVKTLEVAK